MGTNIIKILFIIAFVSLEAYALPAEGSVDSSSMMWFAVFALSLIGVFALYVSSVQVDAMSEKYTSAQQYSHEVMLKHDMVMKVLNDRIKNSTIGIHRHRELIEELAIENPDLKMLQQEAMRIKRDERILDEALQDMENFKAIQAGRLPLKIEKFSLAALVEQIEKRVSPYFMVKNNHLNCKIDPPAQTYFNADKEIIKRIINTVLIEMSQEMFGRGINMKIVPNSIAHSVLFEITADDTNPDMDRFGEMTENDDEDDAQYSVRMLQNHIARELIDLMGGEMRVSCTQTETVCTIMIPMDNI